MKKTIIALVLFTAACGFLPSGKNYPYNMYDRDIVNVMKVLEEGYESGLTAGHLVGKDDGQELVESSPWGKVVDYKVVDRMYVKMVGYYWIDVELKDHKSMHIRVSYHPNLGRVELAVRESEKIKQ